MKFLKYFFSKKYRGEYSQKLVEKLNDIDEQIEQIYEKIKAERSRKVS